ncbi:MAG: MarR family transcriptional regulator [Bacteroidetes bacterium]|nr:MarR family transcriptional regulator [Fibrella sp.]
MDFMVELGELVIASRLRRLSDVYWQGVTTIYRESGIDFEVKWATVFLLIARLGPISVMEIADRLGITHPAVIQIVNELVRKELITSEKSEQDSRKRLLTLSPVGEAIIPRMQPLWDAVCAVNQEMINKQTHNLLLALQEMEDQFAEKSFASRIRAQLNQTPAPSGAPTENPHA